MDFLKFTLAERSGWGNTAGVITELGIGNFKAFGEMQRVPIKPLTLIFGANSSGKSSIIHSLVLAHHAMETGECDAHQTKLAGDIVDLGGFRNYVHKHDLLKTVRLCFETDIDHKALLEQLDGLPEEVMPFVKLPHFGLVSRFGLSIAVSGPEPCLTGIEIRLNQLPLLGFSRRPSGKFQAEAAPGSENYLSLIGQWMLEFQLAQRARRRPLTQSSLPEADQELSPEERNARTTKEILDEVREKLASGQMADERETVHFNEAFTKVIAEDEFSFEKLVLRDPGQETLRRWPSGRGQLAEGCFGGLLGFFREIEAWDAPHSKPARWVEAQAVRHNLSKLIALCTGRIADVLCRISYLGPLRCVPPRHASMEGALDAKAFANGGVAWDEISRNPRVLGVINRWLGPNGLRMPYLLKSVPFLDAGRLGIALTGSGTNPESVVQSLAESPDLSILVFEDAHAATTVSHRDIGFGVSQVLPVLVNAAAMRERLIAIEQPELHLHPAQQAELGDVFIESALGERKNTFLLETHSEHLILRVMRRIRETCGGRLPEGATPVTPKDVSVLYVEADGAGRIVREMPLNERGELVKAWPGGFFEEAFNELF